MSWSTQRIEDLTHRVTKGTTPTTLGMPFVEEGVNFIKAEALNGDSGLDSSGFVFVSEDTHEKLQRSILDQHDVLVTIAGAKIGRCGYVTADHLPANTNQAVGIVRVDPAKANPRFVYYFFKHPGTYSLIQSMGGQSAQPNLNLTNLKSLQIPLPGMAEQNRIASILTTYDDLIENNLRRIKLLEESARLLYREWFVHLRFPGHEHTRIVDGVPEGWERKKMADVCDSVGGGTPSTKKPEYWEGGDVTWVIPSDITKNDCLILLDSEKKISEEGLQHSSAKMLPPDTILMTSRASVGFFGLIDKAVCTNQGFISVVPSDELMRWYLLHNLMARREEIISLASGATYREINKTTFRDMDIIVPPRELLQAFSDFTGDAIRQMRLLKRQKEAARQARDILLPKLINGEIAA